MPISVDSLSERVSYVCVWKPGLPRGGTIRPGTGKTGIARLKASRMSDKDSRQIILDRMEEAKQSVASLFLAGCFSLPPASTSRIAASGPIAILSDLDAAQAETILADLTPSLPAGVALHIAREGEEEEASRLDWPRPPKIFGRPIEDFRPRNRRVEVPCPSCGNMLGILHKAGGGLSVKLVREAGRTVMIPNPASTESSKDPLFSGFKPLAADAASLASVQSLEAGDSGFWDASGAFAGQYEQPPPAPPEASPAEPAATANPAANGAGAAAKSASGSGVTTKSASGSGVTTKTASGLAAYMKSGVYAVVIARTKDASVVKKVVEVMGVSEDEARQKCLKLSLCVARNISLDEAQTLLARFKTLGAKARIIRPM